LLPRINAALAQFVAPVSSSTDKRVQKRDDSAAGGFERHSKKDFKDFKSPAMPEDPAPLPPPQLAIVPPLATNKPNVGHTLIHLLDLLQRQRQNLVKWLGQKSYRTAMRNQRKTGKSRKGAMLDVKVE
jgi:hypothetical protein